MWKEVVITHFILNFACISCYFDSIYPSEPHQFAFVSIMGIIAMPVEISSTELIMNIILYILSVHAFIFFCYSVTAVPW
jgi:hypothetical protein